MKRLSIFLTLLFALFFSVTFQALATGALFVRPLNSSSTYQMMSIKVYDATAVISDQIAVTHVDQTFTNETQSSVEATFVFPLPEGAVITELYYWFNGVRYVASVREKKEAQDAYNQRIRRYLDPALLQELGDNLFKLNIAPINPKSEVRFEITYAELLTYEFGSVDYHFLLKTTGLSPKPLERVSIQVDATTQSTFKSFYSPSHGNSTATKITKIADNQYQMIFGDENFLPDRDLNVRFETSRENVDMHVITYTPTQQDSFGVDSFFALWVTPPDSIAPAKEISRHIVFAADVSSSMEGERLSQLKLALHTFLQALQEIDKFNIVTFGTSIVSFRPDLVPASQGELASAVNFINGLGAIGLTNIDLALKTALQMSFGDSTSNMLIFLTDGYPTWGVTDETAIADSAAARNRKNVRIYPFGIGDDISKPLLIDVARQNGGYPTYVASDDSIALVVKNHFERISKPVLANLVLDFGGLQTYDRFPSQLFDLFWGNQVMQFGRYLDGGSYTVTLNGMLTSQPFALQKSMIFDKTPGGNRAVARLWARTKINDLLQQIAIYGERSELVDAVIDLSIRFGILTPYTALYSDPSTDVRRDHEQVLPTTYALQQNYPNPFNPTTTIVFYIPGEATKQRATIKIYDLLGRLVRVLFDDEVGPGRYQVMWDSKDMFRQDLPSGTYIYKLEFGGQILSKKMTLLR